ncbi:MAG: flagellar hook-associated protein FlgK [Negativicutes bacterium]|nr:flagellar hook-associated protein FlgK [Negativicutes bacterium]
MISTFSGLNTMIRGLTAQQLALNTVGHNVTNANTVGYSRQQVNLTASSPETIYGGSGQLQVGTGVNIQSVTRARDTFMDQQYWAENGTLGYANGSQDALSKIESVFHDDADSGIQTALDNFWNSWQTMSTNSSNDSARVAVREQGAVLVNTIQQAQGQLNNMVSDTNKNITAQVAQINQISSQIFSLNRQISNIEVGGQNNANDLRDQRDLLTDQLSQLANVRVNEDTNHNYIIQVSNVTLVDGNGTTQLATQSSVDPQYGFQVQSVVTAGINPQAVKFTGGEMKALQETNSTTVQQYLGDLSTISQFLQQDFNAVSQAGFGSDNSTGNTFFGDPSVTPNMGTITQTNGTGGAMTVNGMYSGSSATTIMVKIGSFAPSPPAPVGQNQVQSASYSTDGGATWNAATPDYGTPSSFTLANGLTVKIATSANNVVNDTYSFRVQPTTQGEWLSSLQVNPVLFTSNGAAKIAAKTGGVNNVSQSNSAAGAATVSGTYTPDSATDFTSKNYQITNNITAGTVTSITVVVTDPATGNDPVTGGPPSHIVVAGPPFNLPYGLTMSFANSTSNTAGDTYSFSVPQGNASGDNAIALANALKLPTKAGNALQGASLDDYYASVVANLGIQSQGSQELQSNQKTLVNQIDNFRQSTSGVSLDEEMTNMILYQKGYNSAARVVTTIDSMLDTLIGMKATP